MRDYELVIVIKAATTDEEVSAILEKTSQLITDRGGAVTEVNQWGRRKLAYQIKGCTEGNYVLANLSMDPQLTTELEASLELSEDILRHLLVRLSD